MSTNDLQKRWDNARTDPKHSAALEAGDRAEAQAAIAAEEKMAAKEAARRRAETIIEQLGGLGRLQAMTGAKGFAYDEHNLSFKFPNRRGPNYCKVTLEIDDTYTMLFGRIRKNILTQRRQLVGVYGEDLIPAFEDKTGLRLSL
ncbi:MAG: hypothetical protein GY838_12890 [bacterium]|nr:hypothetical protein [bacterium]